MRESLGRSAKLHGSGDLQAALQELAIAEQHARAAGDKGALATILLQRIDWLREIGLIFPHWGLIID